MLVHFVQLSEQCCAWYVQLFWARWAGAKCFFVIRTVTTHFYRGRRTFRWLAPSRGFLNDIVVLIRTTLAGAVVGGKWHSNSNAHQNNLFRADLIDLT